jgi:sugar-specific transcriptional regulator TrmB
MTNAQTQEQSIELLQQLGLKEYEARSFVALARLPQGTAKEISEVSDVPRTRVYDSIRVLEEKGLVEIHHSNPKQFRAVAIPEAVSILRAEYLSRIESLRDQLEGLEPASVGEDSEVTHEVWGLSGPAAIAARTEQLIEGADQEIIFVIGHERIATEELIAVLQEATDRGTSVIIGTVDDTLADELDGKLPDAEVFVSELDWLSESPLPGDDTRIDRLLLTDRDTILASSSHSGADSGEEAVFGRGFDNGFVAIVRRLMITGLLSDRDTPNLTRQ